MEGTRGNLAAAAILAFLLVAGCGPGQTPATQPEVRQESTPAPPTQAPPTETPTPAPTVAPPTKAPPTRTATPVPTTAPPTVQLGPEQPASTTGQVVGAWAVLARSSSADSAPAVVTFKEDGTYSIDCIGGDCKGMNLDKGKFSVTDGTMKLDSELCYTPSKGFYACMGTYKCYVRMASGKPGALRFVAVDDLYPARKLSWNGTTFLPAAVK